MSKNILEDIPLEIIEEILFNCTYNDIFNFCITDKYNFNILKDELFWHKLLLTKFKMTENKIKSLINRYSLETYKYKYRKICRRIMKESINHATVYKYKLGDEFDKTQIVINLKQIDLEIIIQKYNINEFSILRGDILINMDHEDINDGCITFYMFDMSTVVLLSCYAT